MGNDNGDLKGKVGAFEQAASFAMAPLSSHQRNMANLIDGQICMPLWANLLQVLRPFNRQYHLQWTKDETRQHWMSFNFVLLSSLLPSHSALLPNISHHSCHCSGCCCHCYSSQLGKTSSQIQAELFKKQPT